jgi:hypothetical protein
MKKQNNTIFDRIGYKYFYSRLLESRVFNGYGRTPYESVRLVPFSMSVSYLSQENAQVV